MSDSYWNYEDSDEIICPYCGKEYEPSYEDTYIGGEPVECYDDGYKQTFACDKCKKRFTVFPYQAGFNYKTETIDGEMTKEEHENLEENLPWENWKNL